MKRVIMDAGPLVAWFCPKDSHHAWAMRTFDELPAGALVCEAVLAEACHLVAKDGVPAAVVLRLVEQDDLALMSLVGEIARVRALMDRYADAPMDFADACVLRLAEIHAEATVCTTDGHFRFFRKHQDQVVSLLAPFAE